MMKLHRMIAATFLTGLVAAVAMSPAEAGSRDRGRDKHSSHRHDARRHVAIRPVAVPQRIARRDARFHRPYYDKRVWSGLHRHHHEVYLFPIALRPGLIALAPHTYCDGRLFVRGDVVLDRYDRDDRYERYDRNDDDRRRYRWDDRVSGYIAIGGPNVRIGIGF